MLVDVSVILRHDARTGIQRVVRAIWSELAGTTHPRYEFLPVFAGFSHGYCYANPLFAEGRNTGTRVPVGVRPNDKFLGLDLSAHYLPDCIEQLDAWREAGASTHLVVYDLLPITHPHWFTANTKEHFSRWFEVVKHHTDQALCISDQVLSQVQEQLGSSPVPMLGRLKLSGDIASSLPSRGVSTEAAALLSSIKSRPMVLMIGTMEPRKGYGVALDAFDRLWNTAPAAAPDLVIVGKAGWKTEELQSRLRSHPQHSKRLHWLENTSDEVVSELYKRCVGVLFTSRAEGFGLPLVEAAMHRTWILVRDLTVFREQQLPNVLYFSDDRPKSLAEHVLELTRIGTQRQAPPADLPSWAQCADDLLSEIGVSGRREEPKRVLMRSVS